MPIKKTPQIWLASLAFASGMAWANYQTYVVHTYGDPALASVIQNELNARSGGSATMHQDQLIIRATPSDYAHVSALIAQIDTAPTPLTVSVMANHTAQETTSANQINVGINRRVWVNGSYQNSTANSHSQHSYQARTVSGGSVAISQSTLIGLTSTYSHTHHGRLQLYTGTTWVALTDGFRATPRLLPNGQITLTLHQSGQTGQDLNTTLTVPRGTWTKVGDIRTDSTHSQASYGYRQTSHSQSMPVWVKVD